MILTRRGMFLLAGPPIFSRVDLLEQAAKGQQSVPVLLDQVQTAGLDGRAWDTGFVGAMTVDAVHRSVVVRFPGAGELLRASVSAGFSVVSATLILEYDGYEITPDGYVARKALGEKKWSTNAPRWHVVAWGLRRPWTADPTMAPTFNASVMGREFWAKYGAADTVHDRFPARFGPAELSHAQAQAHVDLTAFFAGGMNQDPSIPIGLIESSGLLIKKLELYDARYRDVSDAYEWAVPTGGHGLRFKNPRLALTLGRKVVDSSLEAEPRRSVPVEENIRAGSSHVGGPTAVMPSVEELAAFALRATLKRPSGTTEWQFQRVVDLYRVGGDGATAWAKALGTADLEQYRRLTQDILSTPPRYWKGWRVHDDLLIWFLYGEFLPAPVQDHIKSYWQAWLMPDIATKEMYHPQSLEAAAYWARTQDWRGRTSFFRDGYNLVTSTQNFNHVAAMGALLGGSIVGSKYAMDDGRHGLEHFPLRLWAMLDGTTQEMLDHSYFSVTISAQKMIADFGPTKLDRLMANIILDRSLELLATAYHPNLRRIVNPSGRSQLPSVFVEQDGIYGVLHTLSKRGALKYLEEPFGALVHGMRVWGYDFPPGRVALQSLRQKWAPDWVTHVVDDKVFPFEETSTDSMRGHFDPPLWRRTYLGRHYGLASQDIKGGIIPVIAQWNSRAEPSTGMEELGTLTLRYSVNERDIGMTEALAKGLPGGVLTFQHRNAVIVFSKPRTDKQRIIELAGQPLSSLATVIAVWIFRSNPGWEILVDGEKVSQLPAKIRGGQVITIKDGVTYLGIIPLPATDLGRTDEIVIAFRRPREVDTIADIVAPALTITSYNLQREGGVEFGEITWNGISTAAYGGFIIELGDVVDYGDFAAFTRRMRTNNLATTWDPQGKLLHVAYRTGGDLMEVGFATDHLQLDNVHLVVPPGEQTKAIPYRMLNGAWPYPAPGVDRDTTLTQQGTTGRLEKNGAVLVTEPGRKAYLQTEPISGTYTGYNPFPDPIPWALHVPGGVSVEPNGKVSLLRVAVQPRENRLWIDYASKLDQNGDEMATFLRISGLPEQPVVIRDGTLITGPFETSVSEGRTEYIVPLHST